MSVNRGLVLTGAAGLALVLIWLGRSTARHERSFEVKHLPHPAPSTDPTTTPSALTAAGVDRLLPFTPQQIADAAHLACAFTAAYGTYRYDEAPQQYLRRLEPMIGPLLRPLIQRAATDPATLVQRRRSQEVSTGQARPEVIRAIGPSSITIVITGIQQLTTSYVTRRETTRYALTLTPADRGWQVYAIELAATGQPGDIHSPNS